MSVDLLIVSRDRPMLYDAFRRMNGGDTDIDIVIDRRVRVGAAPPPLSERREFDISEALKTTGWAVVPARVRRQARTDAA